MPAQQLALVFQGLRPVRVTTPGFQPPMTSWHQEADSSDSDPTAVLKPQKQVAHLGMLGIPLTLPNAAGGYPVIACTWLPL